MSRRFEDDGKSVEEARFAAQRLAFGPLMFQATRALQRFGVLGLAKNRGRSGVSAVEVEAAIEPLSLYASRQLLEAGLAAELFVLRGEQFVLTTVGYLLLTDPMTRANTDFVADVCYEGMAKLGDSLLSGKPEGLSVFGEHRTVYDALVDLPEPVRQSWFAFDHFYSSGVFAAALPIVFDPKPKTILELGGNTGKWERACCEYDADVQLTMLDLPGQLQTAEENFRTWGIADRVTSHPVDFLDPSVPFPEGHDGLWLSQFLDCFAEPVIVNILERCGQAMGPESRLYILEAYWDQQEHTAAQFCIINLSLYFAALANGTSKMMHSDRMRDCIRQAGLELVGEPTSIGMSHTLMRVRVPAS